MTAIDFILILALLWAGWKGFSRGLIIEIASVVALVLGTYAAFHFAHFASDIIQKYVDMEPRVLDVLSFSVTFIFVMLAVILFGRVLERLANLIMLGLFNKVLGAALGILKVAMVMSVLMLILNMVDPARKILSDEKRDESRLYTIIERIAPSIMDMLGMDEIPLLPVILEEEPLPETQV